MAKTNKERVLGPETARSHKRRIAEGFYARYLDGDAVLDIGFRGGSPDAQPVTAKAIGVELDYPGYDGIRLPFEDGSQDAVFASHTLEHIIDHRAVLTDWFRVLRIGGFLVIAVPHQFLYERKAGLPSRFNGDHKRFYTPASLLAEVEAALPAGHYRVRSLRDVDDGFSIAVAPDRHAVGCYEIELVIEKVEAPAYASELLAAPQAAQLADFFGRMIAQLLADRAAGHASRIEQTQAILAGLPLPPFGQLETYLPGRMLTGEIREIVAGIIAASPFDEAWYLGANGDLRALVESGELASGKEHFGNHGYFEGRVVNTTSPLFG